MSLESTFGLILNRDNVSYITESEASLSPLDQGDVRFIESKVTSGGYIIKSSFKDR